MRYEINREKGASKLAKNAATLIKCYHAEMESRGPEDSKKC